MNESQWPAGDGPFPLIQVFESQISDRQRLLFCVGCCRRVWHLLTDDRLRHLVELAEDCADGKIISLMLLVAANTLPRPGYCSEPPPPPAIPVAPWEPGQPDPVQYRTFHFGGPGPALRGGMGIVNFRELPAWCRGVYYAAQGVAALNSESTAREARYAAAEYAYEQARESHPLQTRVRQLHDEVERAVRRLEDLRWRGADRQAEEQAAVVRDMRATVGSEVTRLRREITSDADRTRDRVGREERAAQAALFRCVAGNPIREATFPPRWRTSVAVGLARTMYESRDFSATPVLADALEEAGCDNADVLFHCHADQPHARGCWVVDHLLGYDNRA
jgi:hypothetical protein